MSSLSESQAHWNIPLPGDSLLMVGTCTCLCCNTWILWFITVRKRSIHPGCVQRTLIRSAARPHSFGLHRGVRSGWLAKPLTRTPFIMSVCVCTTPTWICMSSMEKKKHIMCSAHNKIFLYALKCFSSSSQRWDKLLARPFSICWRTEERRVAELFHSIGSEKMTAGLVPPLLSGSNVPLVFGQILIQYRSTVVRAQLLWSRDHVMFDVTQDPQAEWVKGVFFLL